MAVATNGRVLSIVMLCIHTSLMVLVTVGFFTLDPVVSVGSATPANTALDIVYDLAHSLFCLVPSLICLHSIVYGRSRGIKQTITLSCSLVLIVQASKLASLTYSYASATNLILGSWVVTLTCLAVDVLVLLVFLTISLSLRLDSISGATDTSHAFVLPALCWAHFVGITAAFLVVVDLDASNNYLTFAGGVSILHAVLLFVGNVDIKMFFLL
jgi:hypothetical protein